MTGTVTPTTSTQRAGVNESYEIQRICVVVQYNFILGLIFVFFCFKLIITHYRTKKQNKEIKPKIKLNHNILYML